MTFTQQHELTWGALFLDSIAEPDAPYRITTMSNGANFGKPMPLVEEVRSMLTDGSLSVTTGHDNRTITVTVCIEALDGESLALGEAALMAERSAEQVAPLVWTPPAGDAWAAVFDVVRVDMERDYDTDWDFIEVSQSVRYYTLTFECLPWARDLLPTVIEAIPAPEDPDVPAVYETISDVSGTSDWTPSICHPGHFTSLTEDSGTDTYGTYYRAYAYDNFTNSTGFIVAIRSASTSLAGFPYLTVDVEMTSNPSAGQAAPYLRVSNATGIPLTAPVAQVALSATVRRYYFEGLPDTIANLRVSSWWSVKTTHATRRMKIYEIGRTDRIEIDGTSGFQVARTAVVGGSAPTQAALTFDAGTDPLLGSTALIYTGQSPVIPMRNVLDTSASVTPDAAMISGAQNDLSSPMVFLVPVARLSDSTYSLLARMNFLTTAVINWSARIVAEDGSDIPGSEVVVTGARAALNDTADPWMIHELGAMQLPVIAVEGESTHAIEVTITGPTGAGVVDVDEAWLCDTTNGAVTVIHEPSAFQLTTIELRSPGLGAPRPAVIGTWVDHGTQNIQRLVTVLGTHLFKPGLLHVFTATDLAKYAGCTLTYFRRHHSHPGPDLPDEAT